MRLLLAALAMTIGLTGAVSSAGINDPVITEKAKITSIDMIENGVLIYHDGDLVDTLGCGAEDADKAVVLKWTERPDLSDVENSRRRNHKIMYEALLTAFNGRNKITFVGRDGLRGYCEYFRGQYYPNLFRFQIHANNGK